MEILGRSIPALQNAIVSGLDSVTAGITESTKASGVEALGIAQRSFSFQEVRGSADLPAVSGEAEYPEPSQYFRRSSGVASDSPISMLDVARTLTDRQFRADESLATFADGAVGQLREGMENFFQPIEGSFGGTTSDASNRSIIVVGGKESLASDRSIIVVGGKVSDASDRSIIVVGGKENLASDRSIIVVGGKTYFETIDDSFYQLQQNPAQQTADLFRQQFGAVQDMITTVDQTVQLQQNLSTNVLLGSLRG
jgi:hypothetical protein